ncbi:hypothetical protein J3E64_000703 [Sphingobium sp. OAS761]|uniref:patatin-like phospholipase family protein n=1 Tax=Sphingobium sp. OAS761 TaxID=2817901 RepID=UPI0020A0D248|nr:patatin-like phospholipase family protein [Sphingobium sp. OAS761]MCP1469032.1 hypothetical protein [Sphingobium sp. OAS761]
MGRGLRNALVAMLAMPLAACATSGALDIACRDFDNPDPQRSLRQKLPPSALEQQIQSGGAEAAPARAPLDAALEAALMPAATSGAESTPRKPSYLLLSGGGQWGAFGAQFLAEQHRQGALPPFKIITGVSTGGLQSLFLGVGTDEAFDQLVAAYSPSGEAEIVDRHPQWQAAIRGAIAGLKPLKRRIEQRICADPSRPCFIDALAQSGKQILIGFVEADSGSFYYVDAVRIARLPDRREARACLTAAALASAAMPVFFQQVRINGVTYYDGGVRQSVFESRIAEGIGRAERAVARDRGGIPAGRLYVVRNGPTTLASDAKANDAADALTNALRAEAIIVNQLEVGSIAALRLERPSEPISLITAQGWNNHPDPAAPGQFCHKANPDAMFDPGFMACLRDFGKSKAALPAPWIALRPITQR